MKTFSSVGLRPELLEALERLSYAQMTAIQARALPPILERLDVVGQAKTGSGKTAAFGLGLLQHLKTDKRAVQALVLCPTRELAEQVAGELRRLAQCSSNTQVVVLCGGRSSREQRLALERGAQVIVGTPGRVADLLRKQVLDLSELAVFVLDEADRMLNMGFIDEVREILESCPSQRQTLLFSATFPEQIQALSATVQRDPVRVQAETQVETTKLQQFVFECATGQRFAQVVRILAFYKPSSALIFCETRSDCDRLVHFLTGRGASALVLHGGLEQQERDDVLVQFANGSTRLLVATNVAARGLDIPSLPLVLIAELSQEPESHVHRIGRTGRAGESGLAISIITDHVEKARLERIEAILGTTIPKGPELGGSSVGFLAAENQTVLILAGRKNKLRKGDVLGALVKDGGIPVDAIGRIDLGGTTCAVAVRREHARTALKFLQRARVKNKRVRAILLGQGE